MDDILEKLARHRNLLVGMFLLVLGVFLGAMIVSGDPGVVAQALGNVVGAAIGAVGAAGAVVWQMRTQDRQRALELHELRRTAFAETMMDLSDRLFFCKAATHWMTQGNIDAAVKAISRNPMGRFLVDNDLALQLKSLAPADMPAHAALLSEYRRLWELATRIESTSVVDRDNGKYAFAHGIVAFCFAIDGFLIGRNLAEAENIFFLVVSRDLRETLKQITDRVPDARHGWADWGKVNPYEAWIEQED